MSSLIFKPLTMDNWDDFEQLFGENGADDGCWCMFYRVKGKEFKKRQGEGNKNDMKLLVENNSQPGILAYVDNVPAGWVSLAPRDEFTRINRSPVLKKFDNKPVWSIVCFFIDQKYRKIGLSEKLLEYAVKYAREKGATIIEGYPRDEKTKPDSHMYVGVYSSFKKMGFVEVVRRNKNRPIMRFYIS